MSRPKYPRSTCSKQCAACKKNKAASNFHADPTLKDGLYYICIECRSYADILNKYKIGTSIQNTKKIITSLLKKQNNKCPSCNVKFKDNNWVVDHCHQTGRVRGFLCRPCNTNIGNLGDSAYGLSKPNRYLQYFEQSLTEYYI